MRVLRHPAAAIALDDDLLIEGDNLEVFPTLPDGAFDLVYIDPPFNTGREQRRAISAYADTFDDYRLPRPRLEHAHAAARRTARCTCTSTTARRTTSSCARRDLRPRVLPQRDHLGLRLRRPDQAPLAGQARHDPRLRRDRERYHFDDDEVDREPYMAPGLVDRREGRARQAPTDCWWHTIVPTNGAREDGLSDAEAGGHRAADGRRVVAARRLVP